MITEKEDPAEMYQKLDLETINCELCGSNHQDPVYHDDRYRMGIKTVICRDCSFVFTNPRPKETSLLEFYATSYRDFYSGIQHPEQHYKKHLPDYVRAVSLVNSYLKTASPIPQSPRILDIGSHTGLLLHVFRQRFSDAELYGVEPKAEFASFTAKNANANVYTGDWDTFVAENSRLEKSFDLIVLNHVLEHLYNPVSKLKKIRAFLKPDGLLLIEVPDVLSNRWDNPIEMFHIAHHQHFSELTLKKCLISSGFRATKSIKQLRVIRCIAEIGDIAPASEPEPAELSQNIKRTIQRRFTTKNPISIIRKQLRIKGVKIKLFRIPAYIKAYGWIEMMQKILKTAGGKFENICHAVKFRIHQIGCCNNVFKSEDANSLRSLIQGREVLILGSGPSANAVKYIPDQIMVMTCNQGFEIYKKISPDKPVGLFLITNSKIKRIPAILEDLKQIGSKFIGIDNPKKLAHFFKPADNRIFKDDGMSSGMLRSLIPNYTEREYRGKSVHPWTSSGIRLLQYALYFGAKKIYLSGIDFGAGGYAWGKGLHGPWVHHDLDQNVCRAIAKKYTHVFSLSQTQDNLIFPPADLSIFSSK